MLHAWNRAKHYRDFGRRVSASRRDQLLNSNEKPLLADGEELRHAG
jgi:hypothetical protein